MKLYQYDDIKKLNQALGSFAKNDTQVNKVELSSVEGKIHYFVLAEPIEPSQKTPKVESKTEDEAKKIIKAKAKKKKEDKATK